MDKNELDYLDNLFNFTNDYVEPHSWKAYKRGESEIKPFSLQFCECKKNGTLAYEYCNVCGRTLLMCMKYGGQCKSGKCKEERILTKNPMVEFILF